MMEPAKLAAAGKVLAREQIVHSRLSSRQGIPYQWLQSAKEMLTSVNPKLPMRNKTATRNFYSEKLGFREWGNTGFDGYLMMEKDDVQIHFFEFKELDPTENYGQVYIWTNDIDNLYQSLTDSGVVIHPHGLLQTKSWGQKEFALLDPDNNLLTFAQSRTQ